MERHNGHPREVSLLVSTALLEHSARNLAVVILEDVTELNGYRRLMGVERSFSGLVGSHPSMLEIYDTIRDVADTDVNVMILGESGTGKELVARALHSESGRHERSFVTVNCGAIPDGLLESELFGHVKGAFTGAVQDRRGRFELADGGTIFLDEIGDLSPQMQVKLLRVVQQGTFEKVGAEKTQSVDVRIICATNRDLHAATKDGSFRQDLYYRLCVMPIHMPPLRERLSDLQPLAEHLLERYAVAFDRRAPELSAEVVQRLMDHHWPGNVRELQNVLQFALVLCEGDRIERRHLPPYLREPTDAQTPPRPTGTARSTTQLDRARVVHALHEAGGNRTKAAEILGVARATLYRFLNDHPDIAASIESPHG
jgi:DNA-binding NtrC family response regulator